ncbi:hypothetical protein B484DRAFT_401199 [Ochromonadaceae sp. CCMP2298]|nr:hypothetical protein B484DRAFT_401199 [Ochromonadaceae sp. CCMP2298]
MKSKGDSRSSATALGLRSTQAPSVVPQTYVERVRKAVNLAKDLPKGWEVKHCYQRIEVGRTKFFIYRDLDKQGLLTSDIIAGKSGRPLLLSLEAKQELHDYVEQRFLHLKGVKKGNEYWNCVVDKIKSTAVNELNEVTPSLSWMQKLTKELFWEVPQADIKNDSRINQFENVRNALSLAAMLHGYILRGTDLLCWTSFDDFSVLLNGDDKPTVITTKAAVKFLNLLNLSLSTHHNKEKRRVITFNCLIAADGSCLTRIAKIKDNKFTEYKKEPRIIPIGTGERKFFVVLVHTTMKDSDLYVAILSTIILPAAEVYRLRLEQEDTAEMESVHHSQSQSQVEESQSSHGTGVTAKSRAESVRNVTGLGEALEDFEAGEDLNQRSHTLADDGGDVSEDGDEDGNGGGGEKGDGNSDGDGDGDGDFDLEVQGLFAAKWGKKQGKGKGKGKGKSKGKGNPPQPRGEQWREKLHPSYYGLQNPMKDGSAEQSSSAFARVIIASDGAAGQIEASLSTIADRIERKKLPIELVKYAGGCSMSQSANDVGAMHRVAHSTFKSPGYRYQNDYADLPGKTVKELKSFLKKALDSASFKTYWKCLMHTPDFLSKAFQPGLVKSAFKTAGIYPYNAKKILSINPYFRNLSTADAQTLVDNIPELGESFNEYDMVPEYEFDRMLVDKNGDRLDNKYRGILEANQFAGWDAKQKKAAKALAAARVPFSHPVAAAAAKTTEKRGKAAVSSSSSAAAGSISSSSSAPAATPASAIASSAALPASGKKRKQASFADEAGTGAAAISSSSSSSAATTTDAAASSGPPAKKKRKMMKPCANPGCTTRLDSSLLATQWQACGKAAKCKLYFCGGTTECLTTLGQHRNVCK